MFSRILPVPLYIKQLFLYIALSLKEICLGRHIEGLGSHDLPGKDLIYDRFKDRLGFWLGLRDFRVAHTEDLHDLFSAEDIILKFRLREEDGQ